MGRRLVLEGSVFGFLTVLHRADDYTDSKKWMCECRCGTLHNVTHQALKSGVKSCGCSTKELLSLAKIKHKGCVGGQNTPEYQSYTAMLNRCYNEKRESWDRYGGRGVIVSEDRWLQESPFGFLNFLEDMGNRPENTTLDRIDSDGNYCKENCRWANKRTQAYNTKRIKKGDSTSIHRGVSLTKSKRKKWIARIGNGKGGYEYLGRFETEIEAAAAYNTRAVEIHGDVAVLNVV